MSTGVFNNEYRTVYEDCSYDAYILAATTTISGAIAAKTGYTIFIQSIVVNVTTTFNSATVFQDDAGTPVVIHRIAASPPLGPIGVSNSVDFGPEGKRLTESKGLDITIGGAGLVASVKISAYRRLTAVGAP